MNRRRRAIFALSAALFAGGAGCGDEFVAGDAVLSNTCDSDANCGAGTCVTADGSKLCVSKQADLAGVILQLEGTTKDGITLSHVFSEGISIQGESPGGAIKDLGSDLDIPAPFALTGRFLNPGGPTPGCTAGDGSVPVKVEARPTKELAGLQQVFTGSSELDTTTDSNRFVVAVPAGRYDVYIVPQAIKTPGCEKVTSPPAIFRDIDVDPDVLLEPEREAPRKLTGIVKPAPGRDLNGFTIQLVDAERGLPVSIASTLGDPTDGVFPIGTEDEGVPYFTPGGTGLVLRLSDPDEALVVNWSFESLDLDGDGYVECDLADLIADLKELEANVIDEQGRPVAGASVTIKSVALTGNASKNASFRVTTTSETDGKIRVGLVAGDYQVLIVPPDDSGPAILDGTWEVSPDAGCCGKSFPLPSRSLVTARVSTERDREVDATSIPVLATPALPGTRTYLQDAFESLPLLPRQAAGATDAAGAFAIRVDAGLYDVTVRPAAATDFPWLVLPSIVIDDQPASTLEDVAIPNPALFVGVAAAQGIPATGATLRAYLPLAGSETKDTSPVRVVQIGETIVGEGGRFVLPVPPRVARVVEGSGGTTSSAASSSASGNFQP